MASLDGRARPRRVPILDSAEERRRNGWIISFRHDGNGAVYATQETGKLSVAIMVAIARLLARSGSLAGWRVTACSCPETIYRDLQPRHRRGINARRHYEGKLATEIVADAC